VIGPAGVFVVETKYRTKKSRGDEVRWDGSRLLIGGFEDRGPVDQAERNARDIRGELKADGLDVPVIPVVVFPGWWVVGPKRGDSWVTNPKYFSYSVQDQERERVAMSAQEIARAVVSIQRRIVTACTG
jgi:hypothetical protein